MVSTFHGLVTSVKGLNSQQAAINTAGHNISNANTKGYSRQVVNLEADRSIYIPAANREDITGQLGTGVSVAEITRARVEYLDSQYRDVNSEKGEWEIRRTSLEKLDMITNEPGDDSISTVLNDFWNSWANLAKKPDLITARTVVIVTGVTLTESINDVAKNIAKLESDLENNLSTVVSESNILAEQIADLNREIKRVEVLGDNANDLRDRRDSLTDELSQYMNISVSENDDGYTIKAGNVDLVSGTVFTSLTVDTTNDPINIESATTTDITTGTTTTITPAQIDIKTGQIKGYLDSINEVESYQAQLSELVSGIAEGKFELTLPEGTVIPEGYVLTRTDGTTTTSTGDRAARTLTADQTIIINGVNGLHKLGYTLEDPLTSGGDFFVTSDGSGVFTGNNVRVNSDLKDDARKIAASTNTYINQSGDEAVVRGNNDIPNWMGELRDYDIDFNSTLAGSPIKGKGSVGEYYNAMIGQLGVKEKESLRQLSNKEHMSTQVDIKRQSVSGVSLDEEMANLVKFQNAYNASARMISTLDELYDKLINGTGVVGR